MEILAKLLLYHIVLKPHFQDPLQISIFYVLYLLPTLLQTLTISFPIPDPPFYFIPPISNPNISFF
jgi:hypothetical protein